MDKIEKKQIDRKNGIPLPQILPTLDTLAERLNYLIRMSDYSQTEVATNLGVGPSHISGLRQGKSNPSRKMVARLATFFEVPQDWLEFGVKREGGGTPDGQEISKDLLAMISELTATYHQTSEDEKFMLQGEIYYFLKEFKKNLKKNLKIDEDE